jgi:hypothetical protein
MTRNKALKILAGLFIFALTDSLLTNWLISKGATELNPIVEPIAGTPWLIIVKVGWVLIFFGFIVLVIRQTRWCDIHNGL